MQPKPTTSKLIKVTKIYSSMRIICKACVKDVTAGKPPGRTVDGNGVCTPTIKNPDAAGRGTEKLFKWDRALFAAAWVPLKQQSHKLDLFNEKPQSRQRLSAKIYQ